MLVRATRLLGDFTQDRCRPDSIQVPGGMLSIAAARPVRWVWLSSGLRLAGHRDEAWLKRGLPSS